MRPSSAGISSRPRRPWHVWTCASSTHGCRAPPCARGVRTQESCAPERRPSGGGSAEHGESNPARVAVVGRVARNCRSGHQGWHPAARPSACGRRRQGDEPARPLIASASPAPWRAGVMRSSAPAITRVGQRTWRPPPGRPRRRCRRRGRLRARAGCALQQAQARGPSSSCRAPCGRRGGRPARSPSRRSAPRPAVGLRGAASRSGWTGIRAAAPSSASLAIRRDGAPPPRGRSGRPCEWPTRSTAATPRALISSTSQSASAAIEASGRRRSGRGPADRGRARSSRDRRSGAPAGPRPSGPCRRRARTATVGRAGVEAVAVVGEEDRARRPGRAPSAALNPWRRA